MPCLVLRGYQGARRDSQLVRAVPDSTGVILGRDFVVVFYCFMPEVCQPQGMISAHLVVYMCIEYHV